MDAVTQTEPQEPRLAQVIDLAAWRAARQAEQAVARALVPADPYPWAYTFRAPDDR
jgi:hypothetical protein